jgi:nicotinamide mononucleotide adenylyltransferase
MSFHRTITFGRFNISHAGHIELIQKMLEHGRTAHVYLSTAAKNNDLDTRILMLKHLCREANVDLARVKFSGAANVFDAVGEVCETAFPFECAVVFGTDQQKMAEKLSAEFGVAHELNERTTSSTEMRFFLDREDFTEDLRHIYNGDEFAITLARILRAEELKREKL